MAARGAIGTSSSHHDDEYVKVLGYDKSKEAIIGSSHGDDDKHMQLEDESKESSSSSKPNDKYNGKGYRVLSSEETKKVLEELEERKKIPVKGPFYIPYVPSNKPNGEPGYVFPLKRSIPYTRWGVGKIDLNDETDTDDDDDGTGETDTDSDGYGVTATESDDDDNDDSGTEDEDDDDHDASAKNPRVG